MKYDELLNIVKELQFDTKKLIYKENNSEIYIYRPSKLPKRFNNYDSNRNFQIWFSENKREFRPNHLRVLIDLNLRVRCRPELKKPLLLAFDNIFYGNDPIKEIQILKNEIFEHFLNSLNITAILAQLFIIEQAYSYTSNHESKYDPPTLFLQGWIREFIDNPKEIDNLCMSVCNRQPPLAKYTNKENKNSSKYESNISPLWYL
ncbi:hypothetical protein [Haloimpatiens massiliensis]|uniref:hypothetical protein n=1 Tax=Haloimpatiens massiliensis TaxID=1658110 RepID=UPI000C847C4B|nr:hypothetical protein [Haloimpatiens massiliensis]